MSSHINLSSLIRWLINQEGFDGLLHELRRYAEVQMARVGPGHPLYAVYKEQAQLLFETIHVERMQERRKENEKKGEAR